jgi:Holliday junction resolvase RusA-like endonuclease
VNHAYAWTAHRYRSKEYMQWLDHANLIMNRYDKFRITWDEWLGVEYDYEMPLFYKNGKKKVQDVANLEKVLSDFLVKRIPWFEDHKIREMTLRKKDSNTNYVTIRIYEHSQETT